MQTLLLVSVIFGLLIQRSLARLLADRCGLEVTAKITSGTNADMEAAAWMAVVRNETHFLCGGTLIHKRFVLTAAHCIEDQGRLFVELRAYNYTLPTAVYGVTHAEFHRGYDKNKMQHDIGLLKLPLDVVFTEKIHPICINLHPTGAEDASSFDAYGWGETLTARISEILQRVTLHRYDRSRCNNLKGISALSSNQICAGSSNRDTCHGDSGGPLVKEFYYDGIRRLTQLGIVSYGVNTCTGLGVYTDVARYVGWIEDKIKSPTPQYYWPTSFAPVIANPVSVSPQSETVPFVDEKFNGVELLEEPCGTAVSARIMDGYNAEPEAGAWMAAVYNRTHLNCGGTVIHRRFVLTSARCASIHSDLRVKLGEYNIDRPTVEFIVTKKIMHDKFDQEKGTNDIGLLQLSPDVTFNRHVYPVCIILTPEVKSKVENLYTFDAYAWGIKDSSHWSRLLQKVTLDRHDHSACRNIPSYPLSSSQICAGASVGSVCKGDEGGPLTKSVFLNGLQRQTQFGVISKIRRTCDGIGIYTDVTSYVDWIVRNLWNNVDRESDMVKLRANKPK